MKLSAILITKNEEKNIEASLEGLTFCDEVIVVDSESSDQTFLLAQKLGAQVFTKPFKDFSDQKNFSLSKATGDWVLSIDADERVSSELQQEIKATLKNPAFSAYRIPRTNIIFGQTMQQGANKRDAPLRLFKREKASFKGRIHESLQVRGTVGYLKSPLMHYSTETLKDYIRKLNQYTTLEAEERYQQKIPFRLINLIFRGLARFVQRYFFQQAYRDGRAGFIFSFLSGFYEFICWVKLWELYRQKSL